MTPYLYFRGDCEAALRFYAECGLGHLVELRRYDGTPMVARHGEGWRNKVLHAVFEGPGLRLCASDGPDSEPMKGCALFLERNHAEALALFAALSTGGRVTVPFQKQFWGHYGNFTDRFGVQWAVSSPARVSFRPLGRDDLPLLYGWLCAPHVVAHWEPAPSLPEVEAEYGSRIVPADVLPLDVGLTQYIAEDGTEAVGFIQAYRVMSPDEDWWPDETDPGALGMDQLIGLPDRLGQGLGTRLAGAFSAWLFLDQRVTSVQVDPHPDNLRAIAAYRRAGFADVGVVETPDGPALIMKRRRPDGS